MMPVFKCLFEGKEFLVRHCVILFCGAERLRPVDAWMFITVVILLEKHSSCGKFRCIHFDDDRFGEVNQSFVRWVLPVISS